MNGVLIADCKFRGLSPCSVLIEGGRIGRIFEEAAPTVPVGAEIIEANGGQLLPGFVDSHCHPFEYGWLKRSVDLRGTTNVTGMRLRLLAAIQRAKPGEWVTGMGWDQISERILPRRLARWSPPTGIPARTTSALFSFRSTISCAMRVSARCIAAASRMTVEAGIYD